MPLSIKTLQQFALKVHNFAYGTEWDDEDIVSAMAFDEIIEKMMKDEKKLEEQVKKVQEAHCDAEDKAFHLFSQLENIKKEVKELKDFSNWENHPALKHKVVLDDDFYLQHLHEGELIDPDDYKKLEKENKELKEEEEEQKATVFEVEKDEGGFDHWAFEKADTENNVDYFNELKAKGYENTMKSHRKMTSCFDWKNFDAWVKTFDLPSPFLPYPREKFEGEFNDFYESVEEEQKAIIEYFKLNKPRSIEAVKKFVDTNEVEGNEIIEVLKGLKPEAIKVAYWGYEEITKAYAQEDFKKRIKVIGSVLNSNGGIDMMRLSFYLFTWDLHRSPMVIKGAKSLVEFYWGGIGEWLA